MSEAEGALARACSSVDTQPGSIDYSAFAAAILADLSADGWRVEREGLGAAWAEAEAVLPDGWSINMLWGTVTEDRWAVGAGPFPSKPGDRQVVVGGSTPAAALHALASCLRGGPDATD